MLCDYGCGNLANYTFKNKKNCCSTNSSKCPGIKNKLKEGYATKKRKPATEIYQSLSDEAKERMAWSKGKCITPLDQILKENSNYSNEMVKHRLLSNNLLEYKCENCDIVDSWLGKPITLDLDHINGNSRDNRVENLRFLCPNCHSQTETYKGKNINRGKLKVSDAELLTAFEKCGNIRQALIEVGLAAKGGNYERLKRLTQNK